VIRGHHVVALLGFLGRRLCALLPVLGAFPTLLGAVVTLSGRGHASVSPVPPGGAQP
jgi:hypothetical protein